MKNLKITLLVFLLLFLSNCSLNGQTRYCPQVQLSKEQLAKEAKTMKRNEKKVKQWIKNANLNMAKGAALPAIVTIPVVVHILYHNQLQNISDDQVISQIEALNRDFRRLNADTINTPAIFIPVAADCQIEFCLAQRTPEGYPSNGITRTFTSVDGFEWLNDSSPNSSNYYKKAYHSNTNGIDAWDTTKYLNIYVGDFKDLHGISNIPVDNTYVGTPDDVVFVRYTSFGTIGNLESAWTEGGIATHEVGHYLNLYHTYNETNCDNGGDNLPDTPTQVHGTIGCPNQIINSCTDDNFDLPDMTMNFMDNTDDPCINMFTIGQSYRMLNLFDPVDGLRKSLKTSNGCSPSLTCGPPVGLKVTNLNPSSVTLQWDTSFSSVSYKVRLYKNGNWANPITTIINTPLNAPDTFLNVFNLLPNTNYTFDVISTCANGNGSNASSAFNFPTPACSAPSSGLTVTMLTPTTAQLNWNAANYATGYKVELFDGIWKEIGNTNGELLFLATGLISNKAYKFRVTSICSSAISAVSADKLFNTPPCSSPSSGLIATMVTPTSAQLNWNAANYATGYKVELFDVIWKEIGNTNGALLFLATGLTSNTAYKFRVTSFCSSAISVVSAEKSFKTLVSCNPDSYEPNNTFATAYFIAPSKFSLPGGASKFTQVDGGLICKDDAVLGATNGDIDWYSFTNGTPFRGGFNVLSNYPDVKIDLNLIPQNYIVELYNAANVKIGIYDAMQNSIIYHPCNGATGSYFIKVYRNNIGLINLSQTYSLKIVLTAITYPCPIFGNFKNSTEKELNEDLVTLFPNPNQGKINIVSSQKINSIKVSDINGKALIVKEINAFINNYELDITAYPVGTYLVQISGDFGVVNKKVIKN